jgi:F0F1-type ATP synthase assembly protein I
MNEDKNQNWSTLQLAWNLGFQIALPLVAFALVGRYLDAQFATGPWLFLLGVLAAIIASSALIYRKLKPLLENSEKEKK